jgi:hypothetical protein
MLLLEDFVVMMSAATSGVENSIDGQFIAIPCNVSRIQNTMITP